MSRTVACNKRPASQSRVKMADLLESIAAEIEVRQAKLKPTVVEYKRLQIAAAALGSQPKHDREAVGDGLRRT